MVFSSLIFLFSFLPFLLIGNYLWRNRKWQNVLLFGGSLYFYAWGEKEKVFVMLGSIIVNYLIGLAMEKNDLERKRRFYLTIGIIINLGVLVYFKYTSFFIENINAVLQVLNVDPITGLKYEKLPLGVSFYTFQSLSYLIDVYRRQVQVQRNFLNLGLYITLFPQLVAGPIVRYNEIEEQLRYRKESVSQFNEGIKRFIIGLSKKMLLANPIAFVVDEIYQLPADEINTPLAWMAMIGYALQIYFDFSGYSDMAIGLGRMFGFKIPENFNFPYIAKSIREFWTRWHISLSGWFRDYLYIPLGGNRGGNLATYRNLFIVFLVTGLWHGASWNFILWGLLHGFFMIIERLGFNKILKRAPSIIQISYTVFIAAFAFILFRVESFDKAFMVQKSVLGLGAQNYNYTVGMFMTSYSWLVYSVAIICSVPIVSWIKIPASLQPLNQSLLSVIYFALFFFSIMAMASNTYSPFIYFRF
jgi:alginate O-acetyltransferase complex protein AlgI